MSTQEVLQDIRKWLGQQPDWIQRAAETILTSGTVTKEEVDNLYEHLKTPQGAAISTNRNFQQLSPDSPGVEVRINKISVLVGVDNLAPKAPLDFGTGNLVVVFGQNGSGKSGYTRLVKKICGKSPEKDLKPNVFEPVPAVRRCNVSYKVAGETRSYEWVVNAAPISELLHVDVFDAETASVYLTKESAASFTPRCVQLFESLASVCDQIKLRIQSEQSALVKALPVLPSEYQSTAAGIAYSGITMTSGQQVIRDYGSWSREDDEKLVSIETRLAADPSTLAKSKRAALAQVEQLLADVQKLADAYGTQGTNRIIALRDAYGLKRKIADDAAKSLKSELDGIGTDSWRAMWEAAREFSAVAYPARGFPVLNESRCVLCHQAFDESAKSRMAAFDEYVSSKVEGELSAALKNLNDALEGLPVPYGDKEITTRCQAARLDGEGWRRDLLDFMNAADVARASLLEGSKLAELSSPESLLENLKGRRDSLEAQASQHDLDARNFDLHQIRKDKNEQEARRWVSQQISAIKQEIERLEKVDYFESLKRSSNSQKLSAKAGDVSEKLITEAYVTRFNQELDALGAKRLKIELVKTRTEKGRSLHKLRLVGVRSSQDVPEIVLSEGERRIVSLAAFLADVAECPRLSPFIFDDPISSLDSDFEWNVAKRLGALAMTRQVLVFTHRLSLCGVLEEVADGLKRGEGITLGLEMRYIERFSGTVGHPADYPGWAEKTKKSNDQLILRLGEAYKAGIDRGSSAYIQLAQGICSDFRKLIEATIEADLLQGVILRHRRSVQTKHRLLRMTHLKAEDCRLLDELMTKYSDYEHSQSSEKPVVVPDEPELRQDLIRLKDWRSEYSDRMPK